MTLAPEGRKVLFGQGRVRVTGSQPRGIVVAPPPPPTSGGQGHGAQGGQGQGRGGGQGKGRGGGNSLAALAQALAAVSATGSGVVPSGSVGTTWYSGTGAPSAAVGTTADWYCNNANLDVYRKDPSALAAPAFVAAGTPATGTASSVAVPMPVGIVAGQTLLLIVFTYASSGTTPITFADPTGWTHVVARTTPGIQALTQSAVDLFYKVATNGEGSTIPVSFSASAIYDANIVSFSGASGSNVFAGSAALQQAVTGTSQVTPSVATASNQSLLLSILMSDTAGAPVWTPPAGFTTRATSVFSGLSEEMLLATGTQASQGSSGSLTWTNSRTPLAQYYAATLPLAPVPASGATWGRIGAFAP